MFFKLRNRLNYSFFDYANRAILDTPILPCHTSGPYLVSQVCERDIILYLLALKSFQVHIAPSRVYALDDGSLSQASRDLLKTHIEKIEFLDIEDFRNPHCPEGGTWERLLAISHICQSGYVIQMDSDILTTGPIPEVLENIQADCSFTIGTYLGRTIETMREAREKALSYTTNNQRQHIQVLAEANFDKLDNYKNMRYVRGCSGFTGFSQGSLSTDFLVDISTQMYSALGKRWEEWGSEQVSSNIAVANCPVSSVLPFPDYCNCEQITREQPPRLIHFIGPCRFKNGIYTTHATKVIQALKSRN